MLLAKPDFLHVITDKQITESSLKTKGDFFMICSGKSGRNGSAFFKHIPAFTYAPAADFPTGQICDSPVFRKSPPPGNPLSPKKPAPPPLHWPRLPPGPSSRFPSPFCRYGSASRNVSRKDTALLAVVGAKLLREISHILRRRMIVLLNINILMHGVTLLPILIPIRP